jgi:hypothetical protein
VQGAVNSANRDASHFGDEMDSLISLAFRHG